MRLNVYLISHPIIQKLSSNIKNCISQDQIIKHNYHIFHLLNILLIYEVVRKWMKTYNIYIPNIDSMKELCISEPRESYLILTNLTLYGNILLDIHNLLPKVDIKHINLGTKYTDSINNNIHTLHNTINDEMHSQKIIIIDNFLTISLIRILDYLIIQKKVNISYIKIICIICNNDILEQIGERYPLISIYTTKIYP